LESEFAKCLRRGIFKVPVCKKCKKKAWPPSSTCPACYSFTALQQVDRKGVIIEFGTSHVNGHEGIFGIVEMAGFRLVGSFDSPKLSEGMLVRMMDCGMRDDIPYYLFAPEK
jgi:uncharacterized OB-fold protein